MNKITYHLWGNVQNQNVYLFKIQNASGAYIELCNYGATLVSVFVPNRNNELGNIVLGFGELEGYLADECYMGSTIGRFANRIGGTKFTIDGITYTLEDNDQGNSNHGGRNGFNAEVFNFKIEGELLSFGVISKDGAGGYPGNLDFQVGYQWTDDNEILIDYSAVSDQKTIANFTNHAYFNLGAGTENMLDHELTVFSDLIVAAGSDYIPTGLIVPADDLAFKQNKIKEKLTYNQGSTSGLNVCYFLAAQNPSALQPAAVLSENNSGRVMEVFTTYPGILVYTGDFLHSKRPGHNGNLYGPFDGLCLECQYLPDSPNHAHFPSAILSPGEVYKHTIVFKFSKP